MITALVRQFDRHHFVGFFAAPDLATLGDLVEEIYEKEDCGFAQIASGGFFCGYPSLHNVRLPLRDTVDRDDWPSEAEWPHSFRVFEAGEPTDGLAAAMSDASLVWKPLDATAA